MKRQVTAQSGHTFIVESISKDEMPEFKHKENYENFYKVCFGGWWVPFYLGKGYKPEGKEIVDNKQIVVWYRTGDFWSSYGTNFKSAIDGAQKDACI